MYKKLFALSLIFLLAMCGISSAASTTTEYDPYNLYFWYVNSADEAVVYDGYGNGMYNFFYQLRDVTGAARNDRVAGPQWFATVYENYYRNIMGTTDTTDTTVATGIYRRTMGGEIPDVRLYTVGDIIEGFNFVFAEEPQPYETAWRRYINNGVYDIYPDPLESFCLVITNGQGEFNLSFGNPYAREFPFWWNYGYTDSNTNTKWWQRYNDWRDNTYRVMEPVEYIYSDSYIYHRTGNGRYEQVYVLSEDISGDVGTGAYYINDLSGNTVYTLSGDLDDTVHYWLDSDGNTAYTVSNDMIYDANNTLKYTIENSSNQDETGDLYICEVREIYEQIAFSDFDEEYTITVNPSSERAVLPGNYLDANIHVRGIDAYTYGSTLGYMNFRQRASFAQGYSNYRESTLIPMVIANVSDGNASDNPLLFDMIVFTQNDDVVNRIKFTWDAQSDMPNQDLGTFFMMKQFNQTTNPTYKLETRITNRTGTRYELYRYDEIRSRTGDNEYRDNYRRIMPDFWKYDLTPDLYGTLPDYFLLDAKSQIAPGLVTVYKNNVGEGYRTIDTQYDTSESFRLYEYSTTSPKNLRLNYKRVAGITTADGAVPYTYNETPATSTSKVIIQGFNMQFADITQDENETEYQLTNLMGKAPAMVPAELSTVMPIETYIRSSALNAFTINRDVPVEDDADFANLVSYEEIVSEDTSSDENTTSGDNTGASALRAAASYTSQRAALQPVSVRLRIPRQYRLVNEIWNELDSASNSRQLFERFANHGAIWVRSSATREQDTNLFTAINNKGSSLGVSASDCIKAFLYNDKLYLDFIVFIADAKSINANRTAFIEIFKDDDVPYILIGDGAVDKKWDLTFFVDATGSNPETRDPETPTTPVTSDDTKPGTNTNTESKSSSGGGGCNAGMISAIAVLILAGMFTRKR
ncbi:MAG: hypothetical protein IJG34_03275 [Synergistaceae bacterium]|nr:hypothetical protein [Synergistaceae bacterium]